MQEPPRAWAIFEGEGELGVAAGKHGARDVLASSGDTAEEADERAIGEIRGRLHAIYGFRTRLLEILSYGS